MTDPSPLSGNGAGLVRELLLARSLQRRLERLYRLDRVVAVEDFAAVGEGDDREALFVREEEDGGLSLALRLPALGAGEAVPLDRYLQVVEGVSHFVYLAERWRRRAEVSQLELEAQAEVDKWAVFATASEGLAVAKSQQLRARLYEGTYLHAPDSEAGIRYRTANRIGAQVTAALERFLADPGGLAAALRSYFHAPRSEKLAVR